MNTCRICLEEIKMNDEDLLTELGIDLNECNIIDLKHVRGHKDRKNANFIGRQKLCIDFNLFSPLFQKIQDDLKSGVRSTIRHQQNNLLKKNDWFILNGLFVYVAEISEYSKIADGHLDARLRIIFSNGTESNILMRSLTNALYKDETGRRIVIA